MTEASGIRGRQWRLAARWFERADGDVRIAETIVMYDPGTIWGAAFHCQQAAEKIAKGMLIAFAERPPRTHNVEAFADLVQKHHPEIAHQIHALGAMTTWYFAARYPGGADESLPFPADVEVAIKNIRALRRHIDALAPKGGDD